MFFVKTYFRASALIPSTEQKSDAAVSTRICHFQFIFSNKPFQWRISSSTSHEDIVTFTTTLRA